MDRLANCAADQVELHKLEWENRKRADEVWELQKVDLTTKSGSFPTWNRMKMLSLSLAGES